MGPILGNGLAKIELHFRRDGLLLTAKKLSKKLLFFLKVSFFKVPVRSNRIFFNSYDGQYADSPKYISQWLHQQDPDLDLVWLISSKSNKAAIPDYIRTVDPKNKFRRYYYEFSSKVVIDNILGTFSKYVYESGSYEDIKKFNQILAKSNQLRYSTWHGTPLKKMGIDQKMNQHITGFSNTLTGMFLGNAYSRSIMERLTFHKLPIEVLGSPRNDLLFQYCPNKINDLKGKLNLPLDKKIALFAPTFRSDETGQDDLYKSGIWQINLWDFDKLCLALKHKFLGEWIIVGRFHDHVITQISWPHLESKFPKLYNGNVGDDMAEYLAVSDLLITDCSSCVIDFSITKRPAFLFFPDYEHYANVERGFYLDMIKLPFPLSQTFEELLETIANLDEAEYQNSIDILLKYMGTYEDGKSTERIARLILQNMKERSNEKFS